MKQFFFDTEFMEQDGHVELLSIGVVRRDERGMESTYLVNSDADHSKANEFVQEHVIPYLLETKCGVSPCVAPMSKIAEFLEQFLDGDGKWEAWAYYADYDWVAFCSLWGRMVDLPKQMPFLCMDVKQYAHHVGATREDMPNDDADEHHALVDARWTMRAYDALCGMDEGKRAKQETPA